LTAPAPARLFLTGFMGAGKSAVGRRLARRLGWEFVDLDQRVEAAAGMPVAELFARCGEQHFRRLERAALAEALTHRRLVLALGGGTLVQPEAAALLRGRGLIIWLRPPFAELAARVEAAGAAVRPLWGDRLQARELYRARVPSYRRADLVLAIAPGEGVETIVDRLTAELEIEACAT
jgi:shikimate kinase